MKKNKFLQKYRSFSMKSAVAVAAATVPFLLFVRWIAVEIREVKSQNETAKLVNEVQKKYKFCKSVNEETNLEKLNQGLKPEVISIKSLDISLPIVSTKLEEGTWVVQDKVANYAEGTSLINPQDGNVGIYGHDRDYVFSPIKNLKKGEKITIFSGNYKATYTIENSQVSNPENVEAFYLTEKPTLTLVTCEGRFSEQRYIVRASLDRIEEINCSE